MSALVVEDVVVSHINQDQQLVLKEELVLFPLVDIHLVRQVVMEHWHLLVTTMILVLVVVLEILMVLNHILIVELTLRME